MNDNENKMNKVMKFIKEHETGLIACACTSTVVAGGIYCYLSGRIQQYNIDAIGFSKQLNEALKTLDDETKLTFIQAFNAAASTISNH